MKKKFVALVLLMFLMTSMVSAATVTIKQIRQPAVSVALVSDPVLFDWGVDQEQTENCGHGIVLTAPLAYAQSFTPTKEKLTAVRLHIFRYGSPPAARLTVSIRDNLTQGNLATKTIDTSKVSIESSGKWVLFDFEDISVTPGNLYFIVCSGDLGNSTNAYCWFYNNEDTYPGGEAWIKPDDASIWTNFTHGGFNPDDFCFKTYFRRPLDISAPTYNVHLLSSWLCSLWERFPDVFPMLRYLMRY
jgi:hypothetical protein